MDVFVKSGCIWAKLVAFRKMVVVGQKWLFSGKVVILG